MKGIRSLWDFICRFKYLVVLVLLFLFVGVLSENNLFDRYERKVRLKQLRREIELYQSKYQEDTKALHELETNPKMVEKVAREKYFMKRDNEDVFVMEGYTQEDASGDSTNSVIL